MRGLELKENGALVTMRRCSHFIVSRLLPASLDRCPRGFTGHVAHPSRSILSKVFTKVRIKKDVVTDISKRTES
jgi:hypothetical protein